MNKRSVVVTHWLLAFALGSLLNASLFMLLPKLGRSEPPLPPPVIELEFMAWQAPVKPQPERAKPLPPKPKPKPKPKAKPKPKVEEAKPEPAPEPIEQPVLTEKAEPVKEQQVEIPPEPVESEEPIVPEIPQVEESVATEEPLPIPAPIFQLTSLARFVHQEEPAYPPSMLALGKEAIVKLAVLIDAKGRVRKVEVKKSAGKEFDEAAIAAMKASTFIPGNIEGKPVAVLMNYPVKFILQ